MKMSEKGRKLLIEWEGFETKAYRDSAGLLTIGVGHLLTKTELSSGKILINGVFIKYANGLYDNQVLNLLAQDLAPKENATDRLISVPLTENQADCLISFVFNVGETSLKNSTLLKLLNQGNYAAVPDQLRRWIYSGGQKVKGLVNRRENEIRLWNGEL